MKRIINLSIHVFYKEPPYLANLARKISSKCSHITTYAALFRRFFAQPWLKSGGFLQRQVPPERLRINQYPKLKQWLWLVVLYLTGLLTVLIFTYPIKWMIKNLM